MRDSIGGTVLFGIVLFLFSVFIIFIAFIIKHALVYRQKNNAISFLEKNEGVLTQEEFELGLLSTGYSSTGGYELCRYQNRTENGLHGGYYKLTIYSRTEFPVVGDLVSIKIAITGETRTIESGVSINNNEGWFNSTRNECKRCSLRDSSCTSYFTNN